MKTHRFSRLFRILPGCGLLAAAMTAAAQTTPPGTPAPLQQVARQIDQQVAAFYRNRQLPVPAVTDDATFLRRAFLVTIGRIPTSEEALMFLEIDEPNKREQLIDYLLKSPGFSSHMTNWAFDLLRVTDRQADSNATGAPYRHWIRQAMASNMPWDEFTRKLVAATGDGWDPETAAVGYYTRDRGMPLDNIANTMRVFLGSRMECAQCHDDPFGATERRDFYQLAAFTHGQEPLRRNHMQPLWDELNEDSRSDSQETRVARILWDRVYGMSLGGSGDGRIPLPPDYQYRDANPGEVVAAHTPFGKTVRMSDKRDEGDGRSQLAGWITNRTAERFPAVIANRMWKRVMGRGLTEPADEFIAAADTHHPALAALLAKLMVDLKYDLRTFQHALLLTRTFQFATNPKPSTVETGDDFHGRKIDRLSAEQIWDSLVTLASGDPDRLPPRPLDNRIYLDGKPVLTGVKSMPQLSKEVLALDSEAAVREYFTKLVKEIQTGGAPANGNAMMADTAAYRSDAMIRASELPSPAPRDHFLYQFGASDREVVDGASREANVGQVLALMNGFVQRQLVNRPDAHLYQCLKGVTSPQEKVRRLYITILSRPPTDSEMKLMTEELETRGDDGCRNIVSALVMSSEFLFLQ